MGSQTEAIFFKLVLLMLAMDETGCANLSVGMRALRLQIRQIGLGWISLGPSIRPAPVDPIKAGTKLY